MTGLEFISAGYTFTGRRLANRPRLFLIARMPSSGRVAASGSSHLGPPTAPKSIASESWHSSTVSSGSGVPKSSIALPPILPCRSSKSCPNRLPTAFITFTDSAITSGPMPSPGKMAILNSIRFRLLGVVSTGIIQLNAVFYKREGLAAPNSGEKGGAT